MKVGVLATLAFLLVVGIPFVSFAGSGDDTDSDGVIDAYDTCINIANAPGSSNDCDTDTDGYGNPCDCDYDDSGICDLIDFNIWKADFLAGSTGNIETNMDCGAGPVDLIDFNLWKAGFLAGSPGPSGLLCAGNAPCP